MTKSRREQAKTIKAMRDGGDTWATIVEAIGVSESTGRKLLKELDEATGATSTPTAVSKADDTDEAPKPRSGRYLKLVCSCAEPLVIRTSKGVASKATVRCDDCGSVFAEEAA